MELVKTKMMTGLRAAAVGLMFGAFLTAPGMAQEATQVAGQVTSQAEDVVEEDDEGFEWGLLGLLGLGGLAGLARRPKPVVHDDLRTTDRR
jgi:MYXO-CTERM domain-containing protein